MTGAVFGLLNINKPTGPTSHDIVAGIRRGTGQRRVGHAGTLDPLASGVLVVALGPATRLAEYLTASRKTYIAKVTLGITTDTYDAEGQVISQQPVPAHLDVETIDTALVQFRGSILQTPPVYSAIKVAGKSAHARIRAGQHVELEPRLVTVHALEMISVTPPSLELRVECSPGTYIRSLAHDLGQVLGYGAMLGGLIRTGSGQYDLNNAVEWATLQASFDTGSWRDFLIPADQALDGTPQIHLDESALRQVLNGGPVYSSTIAEGTGRAYAPDGQFVAVMQGDVSENVWRPIKVFANVLEEP